MLTRGPSCLTSVFFFFFSVLTGAGVSNLVYVVINVKKVVTHFPSFFSTTFFTEGTFALLFQVLHLKAQLNLLHDFTINKKNILLKH